MVLQTVRRRNREYETYDGMHGGKGEHKKWMGKGIDQWKGDRRERKLLEELVQGAYEVSQRLKFVGISGPLKG